MKKLLLLLLCIITFGCSDYNPIEETIVTVYYNPDEPDILRVDNTRYESKGYEFAYEIPNDGTDDYQVTLDKNKDKFQVTFVSEMQWDKLFLMQYDYDAKNGDIPWKRDSKNYKRVILSGDAELLKTPAIGYYKFVIIYY
jgi:hypothetical protein